jgi:hypothetical protein
MLETAVGTISLSDGLAGYTAAATMVFGALAVVFGVRKVIGVLNKS